MVWSPLQSSEPFNDVWHQIVFKKLNNEFGISHGECGDHTMMVARIMENMVIIPWIYHLSWRPCEVIWPPSHHYAMIMAMFSVFSMIIDCIIMIQWPRFFKSGKIPSTSFIVECQILKKKYALNADISCSFYLACETTIKICKGETANLQPRIFINLKWLVTIWIGFR